MKIWYIRHNNESIGPYNIEELKTLSVNKDDYVWKEGFSDWAQAKSIPELNQLFINTPPPFFGNNNKSFDYTFNNQAAAYYGNRYPSVGKKNKSRTQLMWIGILLVFSLITYLIYTNKQSSYIPPIVEQSPEQLKADLGQTERQFPLNYIHGSTANHKNLIGEMVIHGTLKNSATIAVFKDVALRADFISKTNSIIGSQNFTVYQLIKPGQTIDFKEKTFVPKEVQDVNITIVDAAPAN